MNTFFINNWAVFLAVIWTLPWKGVALWKAAQLKQKWWFVALLVINTFGILEIIYFFFISEKQYRRFLKKKEPHHHEGNADQS